MVTGGHRLTTGPYARGWFHEPTIFGDVTPSMRIAREEIFGPVVSVMRCRSLAEAIDIGNSVAYGLSASIYTRDINKAFTAMRDIYTGIFYVNAPTIGPRSTCRSAARRQPATATARRGLPRLTSFRNGSRSTWTSAAGCSGPRSTPRNSKAKKKGEPEGSPVDSNPVLLRTGTSS